MSYIPGDVILYKYRVEKWLNGNLYQVTQLSRNARRMLQVLSRTAENVTEESFLQAGSEFQSAVLLSSQISHPNLLKMVDYDSNTDLQALLMEDAPGGSLADRLAKVPPGTPAVSPNEAIRLATQIADGLDALHSRGYVHGDLQPDNIFLDEQGQVKLGGLGKAKQPGYASDLFPSPPADSDYASPEQKAGARNLAYASDIYALGCILFGLLSGRVYTRQQPVTKVGALLIKGPAWLGPLILRMLSPEPGQRPLDGGEAARLLRAAGGEVEAVKQAFTSPPPNLVELLPDLTPSVQTAVEQVQGKIEALPAKIEQLPSKIEQIAARQADALSSRAQPQLVSPVSRRDQSRGPQIAAGLIVVVIFFIILCAVLYFVK